MRDGTLDGEVPPNCPRQIQHGLAAKSLGDLPQVGGVPEAFRLNHHRRDANDGGGANTRTGTGYRSNNMGDNSADNNPRSTPDKGRNKRARKIYQSTRPPSLFEAR
jgi:hypothetical protein